MDHTASESQGFLNKIQMPCWGYLITRMSGRQAREAPCKNKVLLFLRCLLQLVDEAILLKTLHVMLAKYSKFQLELSWNLLAYCPTFTVAMYSTEGENASAVLHNQKPHELDQPARNDVPSEARVE